MLREAFLWAARNRWLERQFRERAFARRAVSKFVPGETAEAALTAAGDLQSAGLTSILTYLGENVANRGEVLDVSGHYEKVFDSIAAQGLSAHVSIKLTHLGLDLDPDLTAEQTDRLARYAAARGNFLWIDMESSPYVDATLQMYHQLRERHTNVGVCIQAYLHRTRADLDRLLEAGGTVRLVKGAYREPRSVALPTKAGIRDNYLDLARKLLLHPEGPPGPPHAIATHDTDLAERIFAEARNHQGRLELNILYGVRPQLQREFVARGVPTRVLISYGEAWYAWYMRRLAERPANVGFVIRSLLPS